MESLICITNAVYITMDNITMLIISTITYKVTVATLSTTVLCMHWLPLIKKPASSDTTNLV